MRHLAVVALFVGMLGHSELGVAQETVPETLQAALFKKIFTYDRTLQDSGALQVFVVHGDDRVVADAVTLAFKDGGIDAVALPMQELSARIAEASVVYVAPGVDTSALESLCTRNGVLTISGVAELAATGKVSVGIGTHDQKPEILIHLKRVKAEGHELAAELLSLARVIR